MKIKPLSLTPCFSKVEHSLTPYLQLFQQFAKRLPNPQSRRVDGAAACGYYLEISNLKYATRFARFCYQ
jgi:hypothetical protein